jgi:hypothetical protein
MQDLEKNLIGLVSIGAVIGVGKLLTSSEKLTFRLILGRAILGSATSMIAGVVLIQIPAISELSLLGVGSALGIVGSQYIEKTLRKYMAKVEESADGKL